MARWEQEAVPSSFSARGGEKHEARNPPEENKLSLQCEDGEITVAAGSSHWGFNWVLTLFCNMSVVVLVGLVG